MPEANLRGAAYREGRDVIHDEILDTLGDAAPAYRQAETEYGHLTMANNASRQREAQELGNQMQSIYSPGMAAAGAAVQGVPGAAMGIGATETLKRVGRDATADVLGATATGARAAAQGVRSASESLSTAGDDARYLAPAAADDSILEQFLGSSPAMAQPAQTQRDAGEHPQAARVRTALQARPEALGEYGPELEDALSKGSKEFGATMMRLQRDPEFMRTVMPALQGARQ